MSPGGVCKKAWVAVLGLSLLPGCPLGLFALPDTPSPPDTPKTPPGTPPQDTPPGRLQFVQVCPGLSRFVPGSPGNLGRLDIKSNPGSRRVNFAPLTLSVPGTGGGGRGGCQGCRRVQNWGPRGGAGQGCLPTTPNIWPAIFVDHDHLLCFTVLRFCCTTTQKRVPQKHPLRRGFLKTPPSVQLTQKGVP